MLAAANVASSPTIGWAVGLFFLVIGGLVGGAGWLTSAYRKSSAEARKDDIEALDHRVAVLDKEKAELTTKVEAQRIAIETLLDHQRGSDKLDKLTQLITLQHAELVVLLKSVAQKVTA